MSEETEHDGSARRCAEGTFFVPIKIACETSACGAVTVYVLYLAGIGISIGMVMAAHWRRQDTTTKKVSPV